MADLLHNRLSNSFFFSSPLNLSSHHHRQFSFIRFSPLNRRFSHSSPLLAKFSFVSSQFDIISRTENSDGSVIFKFGDASEVSQAEIESVRKDDGSLDDQVLADDESKEFVSNSVELKGIVEERFDSESNAQSREDIIGDKLDSGSTLTAEVESSSGFVINEVNSVLKSSSEEENSSSSIEDELKSESTVVEKLSDSVEDEMKSDSNSTAVLENFSDSVEDELECALNATLVANNLSEPLKNEQKSDLNSTAIVEVENSSDSVEDELKGGSAVTAQVENSSDTVQELKTDSISTLEVQNSTDIYTAKHDDQIVDNVVSQSVDVIVEKTGELSETFALMSDVDKFDGGGDESLVISEASHSAEEHVTEEIDNTMTSEQLKAEQNLGKEYEDLKAEPIVNKKDDDSVELISEHLKAEPVIDEEDNDSVELISVQLEAEPILDEETSFVSLDDAVVLDTNKEAAPDPELSGLSSASISLDSLKTSTTANSVIPVASSPESSEVQQSSSSTVAQLDDDRTDTLMAIHPVTPRITLAEPSLDSLSKEENFAPRISISSAAASLTNSLEDLTGGKDAHFVSDNWFGVADGVGHWSFGGVDVGIYAHDLMQNCVKLIKSASAGSTNVKELLQQSAAMTQSTGLARVLIAQVANEVLHVANIGDSGFLIIRNGDVFKKSSPMVHEFSFPYAIGLGDDSVEDVEEYHIDLEEGDLIVTATDGLFDNLYEQEIASIVSKSVEAGMHVQDLAELLASEAQEVGRSNSARSPFADAAQAAGHHGFNGGKFDHVTVIVSLVQRR